MADTVLTISAAAARKLQEMRDAGRFDDSAVRVGVIEDGAAFRYELKVVKEDEARDDDAVVESPAVRFLVAPDSAERLCGATLDYVEGLSESGFKFENPNRPALLDKPLASRVQQALDDHVNPSVASHGGHVSLADVQDERVFLRFGGGCQGCGMADVTLKQGVEQILRREVPEIAEILDITDHEAGENPYYS